MASPRYPTTIGNLPDEVLSDIFVRFLAKEVAQMRCVSKSWNALLYDPSFVKSHLHHSIQNNDGILLFFDMIFSFDRSPFTLRTSRSPDLELTNFIKLPVNLPSKSQRGFIIGSVNGLICFYYTSLVDYDVHIWNPSLSAMLTLPPSSLPSTETLFVLGFGYDPKSDDYKVVRLTTISGSTEGEVYSMIKGSWESISQSFLSHITKLDWIYQVCVDGHLHWLGTTDLEWKPLTIVGFDLDEDALFEIPLPETILDFNVYKPFTVLGALGGKICGMSCVFDGSCEVWVMDEYGVAKSWVKHHVFSQLSGDIVPYGFTSHGEFLFQVAVNDDRFGLYDPIVVKTRSFKITSRNSLLLKFVEYVDSLVSIAPVNRI